MALVYSRKFFLSWNWFRRIDRNTNSINWNDSIPLSSIDSLRNHRFWLNERVIFQRVQIKFDLVSDLSDHVRTTALYVHYHAIAAKIYSAHSWINKIANFVRKLIIIRSKNNEKKKKGDRPSYRRTMKRFSKDIINMHGKKEKREINIHRW